MADLKISELTAASSVGASDDLAANQSGASRRVTPAQMATYILSQNDTVSGAWTFTGNVIFNTGTVDLDGVTTVGGALTAESTANLQGAVDCDTTLNVDGASTFAAITATGAGIFGGSHTLNGPLILGDDGELTIATGAITVTGSYHTVAGEGGANDNLDTITAGTDGQLVMLRKASAGHDITVRNGNGNIYLDSATNFNLNNQKDCLWLMYVDDVTGWIQIGNGGNASND